MLNNSPHCLLITANCCNDPIIAGVFHIARSLSLLLCFFHILFGKLLRTLQCAGIGKVPNRDAVLSDFVQNFVVVSMRDCIGLYSHDICPADQLCIWNHILVHKPHIRQPGFDLSGPGVVSTEYHDSLEVVVLECDSCIFRFGITYILL